MQKPLGQQRFVLSKLRNIPHKSDLLPGLESRQPNVRTSITPEGVPERTVPAAAYFALDREVYFREICRRQLEGSGGCGVGGGGGSIV